MRRFAKITARVVLWTFTGVLVLIALVLGALQFKPVRGLVRDQIVAAVRGSLRGDVYFDDMRWPSLGQIELSAVSLHDRSARPVLTLPSLIVRIRVAELIRGRIQIDRVELDHPYVDFADFGEQEGLISVFGSDEPEPVEPRPPSKGDFSPVAVQIDQICIERGMVALQPDDARHLLLQRIDGCVALHMGHNFTVTLDELRADLLNKGQPVLQLVPRRELPALWSSAADGGQPAEKAQARVGLGGKFSMRETMSYDGYVQIRQLTRASLEALGVEASWLKAPLEVDAHAHSPGDDIRFRVDAVASTSSARLQGEWKAEKKLYAKLESEGIELRHFSDAQLDPLAFELEANGDMSREGVIGLEAELRRPRLGGVPLPACALKAERTEGGAIELSAFDARQGAARIHAFGKLAADGAVAGEAQWSVPELRQLPAIKLTKTDVSGSVNGGVKFARTANGTIAADLTLVSRSFQLQSNVASQIDLRAHADGPLEHPIVDAQLNVRQLTLGARQIPSASLTIKGGPDHYDLTARADDHALALDGWLSMGNPGYRGGFQLQAKFDEQPLRASLKQVTFVPDHHVQIDQLRAQYLGAKVFAGGGIELDNPKPQARIRFGVSVPSLAAITRQFLQSELPGRVEAVGDARGRMDKPAVQAHLRWMHGPSLGKHESEFALYARADLAEARATAALQVSAGRALAKADFKTSWKRDQPLSAALENARHELTVNARGIAIEDLASLGGDPPPMAVRGLLGGELALRGNPRKLELETRWNADLRAGRDPNTLNLSLTGQYKDAKVELGLNARDSQGELLDFDFNQRLNVEQQLAAAKPVTELIDRTYWQMHAKIAKRRLRELPLLRGLGLDPELNPVTVATDIEVEHPPGEEPDGWWKTELAWEPGGVRSAKLQQCSLAARSGMTFEGKLARGDLGVSAKVHSDDKDVAEFKTWFHAGLKETLAGRFDRVGPTVLTGTFKDFDLSQLPVLCERGHGVVQAQFEGKDLFAPSADVKVKLEATELTWDESDPLTVKVDANSDEDRLAVRARFETGEGGELRADGSLPIGFRGKDPLLIVNRAGPLALKTHFKNVNLNSLLAYAPGVARSSGKVHGAIDVSGTLQTPTARGSLQLQDVSFTLPQLGQRFSHLNLKATLDNRTLRLSEGKFKDLDGSASIAAQVSFDRPDAWQAELNLNVRNFPVRKSGVMMGRADANIKATANATPKEMAVTVKLGEVAINLTTSDMGDVQSLEPEPEIEFVDALSAKSPPKPTDTGEEAKPASPVYINIETDDPMWVRRDDFAVQMTTKLTIKLGGETPDLSGSIDLRRGYISVLGTSFDVKRGRVTFTGGPRVDPQLEITAEHDTPSGRQVKLEVTGFVQAPKLAFYVDEQPTTAGEAVTAITGRGGNAGSSKGLEAQVASAAIGMTTGLLSLGARREFGDWVPMLSIDPGDQTKVRFGMEADRFIPNFARGFVKGAYVEGIVATGGSRNSANPSAGAETNTATGTGVLIELMLPKSFVAAGQYGPGTAWSVDLDWRP